jgi:hypothetical protein
MADPRSATTPANSASSPGARPGSRTLYPPTPCDIPRNGRAPSLEGQCSIQQTY